MVIDFCGKDIFVDKLSLRAFLWPQNILEQSDGQL